ncbi:MAG: hypothetical protein ACYDAP_05775 [Thermoplasmataceae archaeon]
MASESVLTFVTNLFLYFWEGIVGMFSGATNDIFGLIGGGINDIFGIMAGDLSNTGIWAIPLMAVLIGVLGAGVYLILVFTRTVDDFI